MTQSERRLGSVGELTPERLAELRRTQYSPVEALRQHIDGAGGLRERMDEGDVTAFEADVVMGYDALQDVIDAQADEIERLRRVAGAARPFAAMAEAVLAMTAMTDPQKVDVDIRAGDFRRLINALALLDGENGGGGE